MTGRSTTPRRLHAILLLAAQVSIVVVGTSAVIAEASRDDHCAMDTERLARSVLDCVEPAIAYVETGGASGTGILLADGYVVSNAHVIDPYDAADITVGEETHEDVPLVGVDLLADVALLGPIETESEPVDLDTLAVTPVGDPVFLVGYPGETDPDEAPAISQGVLSRTRDLDRWDFSYLQTDASIGPGQSGGALVGRDGQVIGLSTLRYADDFALALTAADVEASIRTIRSGTDDGYSPWPTDESGSERFRLEYDERMGLARLAVPTSPEARTVELSFVGAPVFVFATDRSGIHLGVSSNYAAFADELAAMADVPVGEMFDPMLLEPGIVSHDAAAGVFRVDVPADSLVYLDLVAEPAAHVTGFDTTVVSNVPLAQGSPPEPQVIETDAHIDGTIDTYSWVEVFSVDLIEGEKVEIYAGAPVSDVLFAIRAPSETWDEATIADDSGEGLYGTDATLTYTAPETGIYEIELAAATPYATGYQLVLTPAG